MLSSSWSYVCLLTFVFWAVKGEPSATESLSVYIFLHCEPLSSESWVSAHCKPVSYLSWAFHHSFDSAGRFSGFSADGYALEPISKPDLRFLEIKQACYFNYTYLLWIPVNIQKYASYTSHYWFFFFDPESLPMWPLALSSRWHFNAVCIPTYSIWMDFLCHLYVSVNWQAVGEIKCHPAYL